MWYKSLICKNKACTDNIVQNRQSKERSLITKCNIIFFLSLFLLPIFRYLIIAPIITWISNLAFDTDYFVEDSILGFLFNIIALTGAVYIFTLYFIRKDRDNARGYIKISIAFWFANISLFALGVPFFIFKSFSSINNIFNPLIEIFSKVDSAGIINIFEFIFLAVVWTSLDFGVTLLISITTLFSNKSRKSSVELIAYIPIVILFGYITQGAGGFITILIVKNITFALLSELAKRYIDRKITTN